MTQIRSLMDAHEALDRWLAAFPKFHLPVETIESRHALGRVTSTPVIAPVSLPEFTRSAMDGYAVRAEDTSEARVEKPIRLTVIGEVPMGAAPEFVIGPGQAALIHTGGMIPEGADAVAIIETSRLIAANQVEINQSVKPAENIIPAGADVRAGDQVIPAGRKIRPEEIGGLMAFGLTRVEVVSPPRIAILSSGDEVIPPEQEPRFGQVRDINTAALAAIITRSGGIPVEYGILPDNRQALEKAAARARGECDAVVITAGSSASVRDITAEVIQTLGKPGVLVHGINFKPGKPTILAVCDDKPVIGMPGNPVSALVIARFFLEPAIAKMSGAELSLEKTGYNARLAKDIPVSDGRENWFPVVLYSSGGDLLAEPVLYQSNLIFSLVRANGLASIPAGGSEMKAGSEVKVLPL